MLSAEDADAVDEDADADADAVDEVGVEGGAGVS